MILDDKKKVNETVTGRSLSTVQLEKLIRPLHEEDFISTV